MGETTEATATQETTLRAPKRPANPFTLRIRETSNQITRLLRRYDEFKAGWTQFRIQYTDEKNQKGYMEQVFRELDKADEFLKQVKNKLPGFSLEVVPEEVGPQISMASDPQSLLQTIDIEELEPQQGEGEGKEGEDKRRVTNPLLNALIEIGEFNYREAVIQETITKVEVIRALGVDATLECSVLIKWARNLAACFTYLLECKTTYSEEMKSKYAELLADLNNARGIADKLIRTLGDTRGYLNIHEYHRQVGELLRLATIIRKSSLQLADYHDEFMAGKGGGTPLEIGAESIKYVLEGEDEIHRRLPPRKSTEEELPEGGTA